VVVDDLDQLLEATIDLLRRDCAHVRLVQQEPVGVFALEDSEVGVKEGSEALEVLR